MQEIDLTTNLPVWGLIIYTLWKEIKVIWAKRVSTQKKDAESLRQENIDRTLVEVSKYLQVLTNKASKEITKEQTEVIVESIMTSKMFKIIKHIHLIIKENNILDNKESTLHRLDLFFDTINDNIVNKLGKFFYRDENLLSMHSGNFILNVKDLVKDILFSNKDDLKNQDYNKVYNRIHKLLEEYFINYIVNFKNKL